MKDFKLLIKVLAFVCIVVSTTACPPQINPEKGDNTTDKQTSTLKAPGQIRLIPNTLTVLEHYSDISFSSVVVYQGSINAEVMDLLRKHLSVSVYIGPENASSPKRFQANLEFPSQSSGTTISIPFSVTATGLEGGIVYTYSVKAAYANTDQASFDLGKILILPHGPVDLDLASGTLWASENLDAKSPEETGMYYAWGDLTPKDADSVNSYMNYWKEYKWCNGSSLTLTKYCLEKEMGIVDGLKSLDKSDDAAYQTLHGNWHIPSSSDWKELNELCVWEPYKYNNIEGWLVKSKNNNKKLIFIRHGFYWSNTVDQSFCSDAIGVELSSSGHVESRRARCVYSAIRPVQSK